MDAKVPVLNTSEPFPCFVFITCSPIWLEYRCELYSLRCLRHRKHKAKLPQPQGFYSHARHCCLGPNCEDRWRCLPSVRKVPEQAHPSTASDFSPFGFLFRKSEFLAFNPCVVCVLTGWSAHSFGMRRPVTLNFYPWCIALLHRGSYLKTPHFKFAYTYNAYGYLYEGAIASQRSQHWPFCAHAQRTLSSQPGTTHVAGVDFQWDSPQNLSAQLAQPLTYFLSSMWYTFSK